MASIEERIVAMIQDAVSADVLETDHTSMLFRVTFQDGSTRRGVFYPKEWQLIEKQSDDFELEDEVIDSEIDDDIFLPDAASWAGGFPN